MAALDDIFAAHGIGGPVQSKGAARYAALQADAARTAKRDAPKVQPKRGLGTSLLPAGGAIAAGLALAPFTGGLSLPAAIALAGGAAFIGGTAGEAGAQALNHETYDPNKILKEGGLSAAFGGGGAAFQGLRGANALMKAGTPAKEALLGSKAVPVAVGTQSPRSLAKALQGVSSNPVQAAAEAKIANSLRSAGIGAKDLKEGFRAIPKAAERVGTANDYGIKSGARGLQQATEQMAKFEKELSPMLAKTKIPVSDVHEAIDRAAYSTLSPTTESPALIKNLKRVVSNNSVNGKISGESLRTLRSDLGQVFGRNSASPLAGLQKDTFHSLGDVIGKHNKEARSIISEQHKMLNLEPGLAKRSEEVTMPFMGTKVKAPGLAAVRDRAIDAVVGVQGKLPSVSAPAASGLTRQAIRQTTRQELPRTLAGLNTPQGAPQPPTPMQGLDTTQGPGLATPDAQPQETPMTLQDALMQAQQLLGPDQSPSTYLSYGKAIMDAQAKPSGANGTNTGKVSAQQYQLAQQGNNALGQLTQLIQSDPGVVNRTLTPGRGLPGVGGYIANASGTGQYDTLGFAAISSLLRAQSGAAVPDSEVRSYMRNYLPRAGDSPETINKKLQTLQYGFQSVLSGAGNGNAQGISPQEITQGAY